MNIIRNPDGTYTQTMSAAELYSIITNFSVEIAGLDIVQLAKDAGQQTTTPPVTLPPTTSSSGFKGIFAFNTGNSATFAANSDIAGTELMRYWAEINTAQGVYNWPLIDADMKSWVDAGKKVIWRIPTAGWAAWQPGQNSKQGTPQWVLDQGVPFVTDDDGSIKPQYWNTAFLANLNTFVQAFAARYDGNANILAIEIGVGDGGETKPDTSKASDVLKKWEAIGYTDASWWYAIQRIIQIYVESFTKLPLVLMPDASFLDGTKGYDESLVVNYAAKYNVWMQWNGLVAGAKLAGSLGSLPKTSPLICEQLNAAGANKRSLAGDLQTAVDLGAVATLVFSSDLADPSNAATLQEFAAMVK